MMTAPRDAAPSRAKSGHPNCPAPGRVRSPRRKDNIPQILFMLSRKQTEFRVHGALTRSNGGRFWNKFRFGSNSMFREFGSPIRLHLIHHRF
jgi:hypothetical protein